MLKIRQIKPQDAPQLANIIRKSPTTGFLNPTEKRELLWKTNVYRSSYNPPAKILKRTRFLEKFLPKKRFQQEYLVIEDNNKIIGAIRKGTTNKLVNLYLDEKYTRTGKTNQIINYVEGNLIRKIGSQPILKQPTSPTYLIKKQQPLKPPPKTTSIKIIPFKINK